MLTGLCLARGPAEAQQRLPANGGQTTSLGQPDTWQWTLGGSVGLGHRDDRFSGLAEGRAGVYRELLNPVLGLGGLQLEGYSGAFDTKINAGLRLRFMSPISGIAFGADYNVHAGVVRPVLTYVHPVRRGGISGNASVLRADILPGRRPTLMIGVEKPVFRRIPVGSNRPQEDHIRLKAPPPPEAPIPAVPAELRTLLATARDATLAIGQLTVPWLDHLGAGGAASDAAVLARLDSLKRFIVTADRGGRRTLEDETRRLHAAIDRAFSLALAPSDSATDGATARGHATAQQAREILLREIILPYNRLFGQIKLHDTTREYAVLARGRFLQWLLVDAKVSRSQAETSLAVFSAYLEMVESARAVARREWRDSPARLDSPPDGPPPRAARHAGGDRRPGGRGDPRAVHRGERRPLPHQ
ncbi:MAG: hypothetical protein IPK85_04910 [Gemmatimonadetes bacterium]|nr:hypothetical protein [Gemmatimonadota bacterium]